MTRKKPIHWKSVPKTAHVRESGGGYVVTLPNGSEHIPDWSSFDAWQAQSFLNQRVRASADKAPPKRVRARKAKADPRRGRSRRDPIPRSPRGGAPFGKEVTAAHCRTRAKWERSQAKKMRALPYGHITAAAHLRTAKAYEDLAKTKKDPRR